MANPAERGFCAIDPGSSSSLSGVRNWFKPNALAANQALVNGVLEYRPDTPLVPEARQRLATAKRVVKWGGSSSRATTLISIFRKPAS